MAAEWSSKKITTHIERFRRVSMGLLILAVVSLVASLAMPIQPSPGEWDRLSNAKIAALPDGKQNLQPLLAKMAGWRLIKPAQVQAAVKDTGLAQTLLKRLKLQGVVQMGSTLTAYIQVEKQGTQTVKQGGKILDFIVQKVEPGGVTLSLEGVEVTLSH
jgi:hypothetical protein